MTSIMGKIGVRAKDICVYIHDVNNKMSYLYQFSRPRDGSIKTILIDTYKDTPKDINKGTHKKTSK